MDISQLIHPPTYDWASVCQCRTCTEKFQTAHISQEAELYHYPHEELDQFYRDAASSRPPSSAHLFYRFVSCQEHPHRACTATTVPVAPTTPKQHLHSEETEADAAGWAPPAGRFEVHPSEQVVALPVFTSWSESERIRSWQEQQARKLCNQVMHRDVKVVEELSRRNQMGPTSPPGAVHDQRLRSYCTRKKSNPELIKQRMHNTRVSSDAAQRHSTPFGPAPPVEVDGMTSTLTALHLDGQA